MIERSFDVFLAHRSADKPLVRRIYKKLKERGLKPWLDEEEIPPGTPFQDEIQQAIGLVKTAAILIGTGSLGRWQALELKIFITQCVERNIRIIPVLLPGVTTIPEGLLFLSVFHSVSFNEGIDDERALSKMEWGITGQKPKSKSQSFSTLPSQGSASFGYPRMSDAAQEASKIGGVADIFESFFQGFSGLVSQHEQSNSNSEIQGEVGWVAWFVNVGERQGHLLWEDCVRYGCISAGGGCRYRDAIQKLKPGDVVYAYITGAGYVGYGEVIESAVPARNFVVEGTPLPDQHLTTSGYEVHKDKDLDVTDWVVRIEWFKFYRREQARFFSGAFVHRGTLCRLSQEETLEFLHQEFNVED